jgi:Putative papain-like cysteine peptidase (DUF1796)
MKVKKALKKSIKWFQKLASFYVSVNDRAVILKAQSVSKQLQTWLGSKAYEKISLGENCNSSWYLKKTQNKKASYPFDWIFSSPEIVEHAVGDEFQLFLDKKFIFQITADKAGHNFYHSGMFNHRNPLKSEGDYDYYVRATKRFIDIVASGAPIVFVCTVIYDMDRRPSWSKGFDKNFNRPTHRDLPSFQPMIDRLNAMNPNLKFFFLGQRLASKRTIELVHFDDKVCWINFDSKGKNDGVKYLNRLDDIIVQELYSGLRTPFEG